jgi:hypothetical protein
MQDGMSGEKNLLDQAEAWTVDLSLELKTPGYFLFEYHVDIFLSDIDSDQKSLAGRIHAYFIDAKSAKKRNFMWVAFDENANVWSCYEALYLKNEQIKPAVHQAIGKLVKTPNIFLVNRITIFEEFRGLGVGLFAMRRLIQHLARGAEIVALKPFPLQFEDSDTRSELRKRDREALNLDSFAGDFDDCVSRLSDHYAWLGFCPVDQTDYMVLRPDRITKGDEFIDNPFFDITGSNS